ncbi:MAG: hypothetical protein ACI8UO_003942 [Verrucomicrobiales bacterium]
MDFEGNPSEVKMMKKILILTLSLFAFATLSQAADATARTHDKIRGDLLKFKGATFDAVNGITDERSAGKETKSLGKLLTKIKKLLVRAKEAGEPAADVKSNLDRKYAAEAASVEAREPTRATEAIIDGLSDELKQDFSKAMEAVGITIFQIELVSGVQ